MSLSLSESERQDRDPGYSASRKKMIIVMTCAMHIRKVGVPKYTATLSQILEQKPGQKVRSTETTTEQAQTDHHTHCFEYTHLIIK